MSASKACNQVSIWKNWLSEEFLFFIYITGDSICDQFSAKEPKPTFQFAAVLILTLLFSLNLKKLAGLKVDGCVLLT